MAAGHLTEIASHRGGALLWPENSLQAFREALALPCEQLEFDVHLSADGQVVVMHDATLDRMTDATGPVRDRTAAELATIRVKGTGGERVPMLSDVVTMTKAAGRILRLEIKSDRAKRPYPGIISACLRDLDAAGMRARTTVMSFEAQTLAEASAAGGFLRRVLLLESTPWRGMGPGGAIALARWCGAEEIGLSIGLHVSAWGTNDAATIRRGLDLGMDALATDDPPLALRLRG